jgi:hypothetical protein
MSIIPPAHTQHKAIILRSGSGAKTWIENRYFKAGARVGIISDLPPASIYLKSHELLQNAAATYGTTVEWGANPTPATAAGVELDYDPTTKYCYYNPRGWGVDTFFASYDLGSVYHRLVIVFSISNGGLNVRVSQDCSTYDTIVNGTNPIAVYAENVRCISFDLTTPAVSMQCLDSFEAYNTENAEISFGTNTTTKLRIVSRGNWWLYDVMPI